MARATSCDPLTQAEVPGIGDNSGATGPVLDDKAKVGGVAVDRLRSIVERVERLQEERKALSGDIRDIFLEAKSAGFDVKAIRKIIRLRAEDPATAEEEEQIFDVYRRALGV